MLEWDSYRAKGNEVFNADNFRIVHNRGLKNCRPQSTDNILADGHLYWFTGPEGLSKLLSFFETKKMRSREFSDIIRRLHVKYYEEARVFFNQAKEDDLELDPYDFGHYTEEELKVLIKRYLR